MTTEPHPALLNNPTAENPYLLCQRFLFSEWGHMHCISSLHYQSLSIKEPIVLLLTRYRHSKSVV